MNHIFSLIWNPASQSYCPAPETARARVQGRFRKLALALAVAGAASGVQATPAGGAVVDGNALINITGNSTVINQTTDAVTINWLNFDINADESVTFLQPDSNSLALNRVLTGNGTEIQGQLTANGRVFILDANGVLFGQNAQVNVGSLVASTLDLSSADIANNQFTFTGNGTPAAVVNLGQIYAADGGSVVLLGGQVSNQGVIRARLGNVALAAGNQITLDFAGDGLLNVQIDEGAARALAHNGGLVQADGGSVLMTAHASDALLQTVVNNTGVIEAHTLQEQDGKIMLLGGFNGGTVNVSGKLDASAPDGGDGGFIETSGAYVNINNNLTVTTAAANGQTGTWLIDPTDLDISYEGTNDGASHFSTQALQNNLATSNITVQTQTAGAQQGNITVVDPIIWASSNSLTLQAANNIVFNDYLHAPNGSLVLDAGGAITTGAEGHINVAAFTLTNGNWSQISANLPLFMANDFTLSGGTFIRATGGDGASPLQIVDIYGLQGLDSTPTFNAVLMNDIDASGTSSWNAGAGFNPIGSAFLYDGNFDGQGNVITNLTINRGTAGVGLFSILQGGASVSNVGLVDVSIRGATNTGGLIGSNNGVVSNSYVTGTVTGLFANAGGLLGNNSGTVNTSYATAVVNGDARVGGLVGRNDGSIVASYATGTVNGTTEVGGLVGLNESSGVIQDSYWDSYTTNQSTGIGSDLSAQSVGELNGNWAAAPDAYSELSYLGFNFTSDWFITEDSSRPMLRAFLNSGNISNIYQLQGMSANLGSYYILTQNIDASATATSVAAGNSGNYSDIWGGRGFAPVGTTGLAFRGGLNGAGFAIDGLTINRGNLNDVGLFGYTSAATFSEVGLTNIDITGNNQVGGLVGYHSGGSITQSYTTGSVTGEMSVGGLAGYSTGNITQSYATGSVTGQFVVGGLAGQSSAIISQSYATGDITGEDFVGGLVGSVMGTISESYATGTVTGRERVGGLVGGFSSNGSITQSYATGAVVGNSELGGLVGLMLGDDASVTGSYWDGYTTGMASVGVGLKPGTATFSATEVNGEWNNGEDAYNGATYTDFDLIGGWFIAEGSSRPMLRAFLNGGDISNLYQLQGMSANLAGSYTLTQDIDATATTSTNNADVWGGRGFAPVGNITTQFSGSFNGNGFAINGLSIYRPNKLHVGLFGVTATNASLSNISLSNVYIDGGTQTGALVGANFGTLTNAKVTGLVNGQTTVGGVVGLNLGTISESWFYSSFGTSVTGGTNVGGLVGVNDGLIENSHTLVQVRGDDIGAVAGGLVGYNFANGTVQQSYVASEVWGPNAGVMGSFVGQNDGTLINNFWNTAATLGGVGAGNTTGITGLDSTEIMELASFASWGSDIDAEGGTGAIWRIYEGSSMPSLRVRLSEVEVTAYDDYKVYDGNTYDGLHDINGTTGNGVRYGNNYAEFLAVFGPNNAPYNSGDVVGSVNLTYTGDSQGAINAGTYSITPADLVGGGQGYDIIITDGVLTIDQQAVSVTVTVNNANKIYGNADPAFSWAVTSGSLGAGDTLTGNLTRQAGENVGNYTIFGNPNGDLTNGNYIVTVNDGVFTINPRPITISVADASKFYGDLDPAFSWSLSNGTMAFGQAATVAGITRAPGENVGSYAMTPNFSGALASGNYAITLSGGALTISPRDIVIDITNLNKLYGNDDPSFTWAISSGGLIGDDELSGVLSRVAGENVGSYAINGVVDGDLANGNYSYTINNGLLMISPRPVVLTADSLMKIYGSEDPELTWSITGGTLVAGDTLMVNISRADGSNVGTYAISLDASGDATNSNYALTMVDGQLQITPAALTVTANDVTSYWDLMPAFTATVAGLVNGDTQAGVLGNSLQVLSNLVLPLPGQYILSPIASLIGENYQVSFVDGMLNLLSSNPGGNYIEALTSTQLPAREALGREHRANIYEGRALLNGSEDGIVLQVLNGGVKLDPKTLAALGIWFPEAVLFPVNSAVVSEHYMSDLRKFVTQLQRYPEIQILVEGHTSNTGSLALNQRLSEKRAEAVAQVLQSMGLEAERIRTENFDYQRPVATNDTEEGRLKNQRTEMVEDPKAQ